MKHIYAKANRLREWLGWFAHMHPTHCYICGELFDPFCFQAGDVDDGVLLHHKEHDRTKNQAQDVAPVHRGCHRSYHYNWIKHRKNVRTAKAIELFGPTRISEIENVQANEGVYSEASDTREGGLPLFQGGDG